VPFIPPMLCIRLDNPARFTDPRCVAEPKLDGQRAQLHVQQGRSEEHRGCGGLRGSVEGGRVWMASGSRPKLARPV
jgi:hypothetical protein